MTTVKVDDLSIEISRYLKNYSQEVADLIEEEVDTTAEEILKDVKASNAWKDISSSYRKGWDIKKSKKGGSVSRTIYNKTDYQIAHLLELGHLNKDGSRTKARPHLRPVSDKHLPQMEQRINQLIKNGGK